TPTRTASTSPLRKSTNSNHRPSTPVLEAAARTPSSPASPATPKSPPTHHRLEPHIASPAPQDVTTSSPPPTSPGKHRLRTFSRTLLSIRRSASRSSSSNEDADHNTTTAAPSPTSPQATFFSTTSSAKPRPAEKMIARGANERAPPIELPPWPYGDEDKENETGKSGGRDGSSTTIAAAAAAARGVRRMPMGRRKAEMGMRAVKVA
ncbi:hypothetical protein LTR28_009745, partial [Elasticomyces elasticus]